MRNHIPCISFHIECACYLRSATGGLRVPEDRGSWIEFVILKLAPGFCAGN